MVCHGGLGKQDGQPSSEDVGDELIGYLVLKKNIVKQSFQFVCF